MLALLAAAVFQGPTIDLLAFEVVDLADQHLASLKSLVATEHVVIRHRRADGKSTVVIRTARVWLKRPNLARIETSVRLWESTWKAWQGIPNWNVVISDGKRKWSVDPRAKTYRVQSADAKGRNVTLKMLPLLAGFFEPEATASAHLRFLRRHEFLRSMASAGIEGEGSDWRQGVGWTFRQVGTPNLIDEEIWVSHSSFPVGRKRRSPTDGMKSESKFLRFEPDAPVPDSVFRYTPPKGFRKANS